MQPPRVANAEFIQLCNISFLPLNSLLYSKNNKMLKFREAMVLLSLDPMIWICHYLLIRLDTVWQVTFDEETKDAQQLVAECWLGT